MSAYDGSSPQTFGRCIYDGGLRGKFFFDDSITGARRIFAAKKQKDSNVYLEYLDGTPLHADLSRLYSMPEATRQDVEQETQAISRARLAQYSLSSHFPASFSPRKQKRRGVPLPLEVELVKRFILSSLR